jgi:hypothetical protein
MCCIAWTLRGYIKRYTEPKAFQLQFHGTRVAAPRRARAPPAAFPRTPPCALPSRRRCHMRRRAKPFHVYMSFHVFSNSIVWMMKIGSLNQLFCCIDILLCLQKFSPYMFDLLVSIPSSAAEHIWRWCRMCYRIYKYMSPRDGADPSRDGRVFLTRENTNLLSIYLSIYLLSLNYKIGVGDGEATFSIYYGSL